MNEQVNQNVQPLWLRVTAAISLFLIIGTGYFFAWGFWAAMSHWADTYPQPNTPDQSYLEYVWGPILFILLIIPTILTFFNIRWLWKSFFWLLSLIFAFLSWVVWFIVIEATSK